MRRASFVVGRRVLLAGAAALVAFGAQAQSYPQRPITMIVPWGAGGGTDAVARMVASLVEKDLGQPVNVVNRTGGSGVVGHQAIASAAPDGYTIGMITVEITMMHHQKLTDLNPSSYTPIGLVNLDPAGFQVRADAPYKSMDDVLAAIKANPGKFKASGTGPGRHLAPGAGRHAARREDRPRQRALGAEQRRGAGPAGPGRRRRRVRALLAARGAFADRRRQGEVAGRDGQQPLGAVPQRADAEGSHRQRLGHRRLARHRRTQGPAAGHRGTAGGRGEEGLREQGIQGLHGPARLRHAVGHEHRVRQLHGRRPTPT